MNIISHPVLGIIVPCFNEEQVIETTTRTLLELLEEMVIGNRIHPQSFIGYVDDGSSDATWKCIEEWTLRYGNIKAIKLSSNYGHQQALLAGLLEFRAAADCLVSLDVDLQDDIAVIPDMVAHFCGGHDIVYGIRVSRESDSPFKRLTAMGFYHLMRMMGVDIISNHADFRLMSRRAVEALGGFGEVNLFLRGIIPRLGFSSARVFYDRRKREAGTSKYPLRKMLALALDGITSFSVKPLRLVTVTGLALFGVSLLLSVYAIVSYLNFGAVHGWTSIVIPMYMLGGIQLLAIGVIGEYLGKIYQEVKRRPRYIIDRRIA